MAERKKFDLIPGTEYDGLIVTILALAVGFVASQNFREEAWVKAASTAGPASGTLLWAKKKEEKEVEVAKKKAYDEGFNTINPALRVEEIIEKARGPAMMVGGAVAAGVATAVAQEAASRGVDYAVEEAQDWFQEPEAEQEPEREERRERKERRRGQEQ